MTDERRGCPSASAIARYHLCPGSWTLSQDAPPQPESEDAASGNRIHAALAGEIPESDLDEDEAETAATCSGLLVGVVADNPLADPIVIREHRLWWQGKPLWSGKPDTAIYGAEAFLVADYKTGRNEVPTAADNLQIRALVALVGQNPRYQNPRYNDIPDAYGIGAVIQPWCKPQVSTVIYTAPDIARAKEEVNSIVRQGMRGTKLVPGKAQCHHCPAKLICKPYQEWNEAALVPFLPAVPTKQSVTEAVAALPADRLARILDHIAPMQWGIEAAKAEAKRRIEVGAPDAPPGWGLTEGRNITDITDPNRVYQQAVAAGLKAEDFLKVVKITKGLLKEELGKATSAKGKELDSLLDAVLCGAIEKRRSQPSLKEVKL